MSRDVPNLLGARFSALPARTVTHDGSFLVLTLLSPFVPEAPVLLTVLLVIFHNTKPLVSHPYLYFCTLAA